VYGEGDKFGLPVKLELFQKIFLIWVFELKPNGKRRYRRVLLEVPKGCGKTPLSAWIAAYMLANQPSAVIPVAAASYEQAELLFGDLRTCATESPRLKAVLDPFEAEIQVKNGPGRAYKIAAVAGTNDGQRPSAFFADEIHEWLGNKARVHLVISNGTAKREGSLVVNTTTPGADLDSMAGKMHEYGLKVNSGEIADEEFLFVWWGWAGDLSQFTDDPKNPVGPEVIRERLCAAVRAASPAADIFLNVHDVVGRFYQVPAYEFARYHLGQWTTVTEAALPPGVWDDCETGLQVPDGAEVVLSLDGSFNGDSTALVVTTIAEEPHVDLAGLWEMPERANKEWRVPIGDVEEAVRTACKRWIVREVAYDPYRWQRTAEILLAEGIPMEEFPQSPARMTPATKRFVDAFTHHRATHSGDPRLKRHVSNASLREDSRGARLTKEHKHSTRRIDAAVCVVMGLERAAWWAENSAVDNEALMGGLH
jgi:phage terminase large subunit-like protein